MATMTFDRKLTALLLVDPYNDFIAEANGRLPHMLGVLTAARGAGRRSHRTSLQNG